MSGSAVRPQRAHTWVTPKIFADLADPAPGVAAFFDHYADWFGRVDEVVVTFCAGNGDHVLAYPGPGSGTARFDWGRYNSYVGTTVSTRDHNAHWLRVAREDRVIAGNPYHAGPAFVLSEQEMDYDTLAAIYGAFRDEGRRRGIPLVLLEYLEPGSEFCACEWKTRRHPEAASGWVDAGGNIAPGLLDVAAVLDADAEAYASYPQGIPHGEPVERFVARQIAAFVADFGLDGITLGNQFGLIGLWHPEHAVASTPERRAAVTRFFTRLRGLFDRDPTEDGRVRRIYWQDSFWPVEVEQEVWGMTDEAYASLSGIIVSNFAVLAREENIAESALSKIALRERLGTDLEVIYSVDFVDPWYWYRVYLDSPHFWHRQRAVYGELSGMLDGVMFFANDTFGHFVMPDPLGTTLALLPRFRADASRL
ncbi:hypothetical protein [Microbacterium sp. XT11]|uniref:hypothetical protein n=1 Tax=Microbacterium sp. XT11 TaxID=367477 RepID=UPI00083542B5|nr:hypothetical protein [Microbacterium sp. XT11]